MALQMQRWDPFFTAVMSVVDVYACPTLHFDFHIRQLSLSFGQIGSQA